VTDKQKIEMIKQYLINQLVSASTGEAQSMIIDTLYHMQALDRGEAPDAMTMRTKKQAPMLQHQGPKTN